LSLALLGCWFIPTVAHATYYWVAGYISWYDGEEKDKKILTSCDCTTDEYSDNQDAGTIIHVKDDTAEESKDFYKYNICHWKEDIMLDFNFCFYSFMGWTDVRETHHG
jgi:hypothetical protein